MNEMEYYAHEYQKAHRGKGKIKSVNSYSFVWETLPDKNGKTTETVFYKSFFLKL